MAVSFTPTSAQVAQDLYEVLRSLDSSRWQDEVEQNIRPKIEALRTQIADLSQTVDPNRAAPAVAAVRDKLNELKHQMDAWLPAPSMPSAATHWTRFKDHVSPAYESLAASLTHLDVHVPRLRPRNYARNVYHVCNAILAMVLIRWVLDLHSVIVLTAVLVVLAWSMELSRRIVPAINDALMAMFRPFAHPHEAWRINSATWYTSAMFILACMQDLQIASAAVVTLGFADPAAAIVGRRWGSVELVYGRTLEGTLAFVAVGTVTVWIWLVLAYAVAPGTALALASVAGVTGALGELFSRRIDDNLSIPVSVAIGQLVAMAVLGI